MIYIKFILNFSFFFYILKIFIKYRKSRFFKFNKKKINYNRNIKENKKEEANKMRNMIGTLIRIMMVAIVFNFFMNYYQTLAPYAGYITNFESMDFESYMNNISVELIQGYLSALKTEIIRIAFTDNKIEEMNTLMGNEIIASSILVLSKSSSKK
jgi:hypothetical protein